MAALKKPTVCDNCDNNEFKHLTKPERWVCICGHVQAQRAVRNDPNKCRECGATRESKPFKKNGNICLECLSKYNEQYRGKNADDLETKRKVRYQSNKKKYKATVRKTIQRSPEAFIRNLMHHITKKCNYRKVKQGKLNPACLDITIDFDYLWGLWETQDGKCALSKLPMVHEFNNLCSISVDRVDSELGYAKGNVQLVCKWVNLAKGSHSNIEFGELLDTYYERQCGWHTSRRS